MPLRLPGAVVAPLASSLSPTHAALLALAIGAGLPAQKAAQALSSRGSQGLGGFGRCAAGEPTPERYAPSVAAATVGVVGEAEPPAGSTVIPRAAAVRIPLTTAGFESASASMRPCDTGAEPSLGISHIW